MALTLIAVPTAPAPRSNPNRTIEGNVVWKLRATSPTTAITTSGRRTSGRCRT